MKKSLMVAPGENRKPKVSILVVSFNTRQLTLECLESVVMQAEHFTYELIVIDNASSDGSYDAIVSGFPEVVSIKSEKNLGFAAANNVAAQKARGEYLLLLNPDTLVLDHAVDRLVEFALEEPSAKIWGGKTLFGNRELNPKNCYRQKSLWNLFCRSSGLSTLFPRNSLLHSEGYGGWQRDNIREVDIIVGCFFLLSLSDWRELEGFDLRFFMYCEEADLCLRAIKTGAQPMVTPKATIVHYGGASEKARDDKMIRLLTSTTLLIERHFHFITAPLGVFLLKMWPLTRMLAYQTLLLLSKRTSYKEGYEVWRNVWEARNQWANP